jgi:hypothetical protein
MSVFVYYVGRLGQIAGMLILLEDVFTAGPMGPDAKLFAIGVGVFLAGWGIVWSLKR